MKPNEPLPAKHDTIDFQIGPDRFSLAINGFTLLHWFVGPDEPWLREEGKAWQCLEISFGRPLHGWYWVIKLWRIPKPTYRFVELRFLIRQTEEVQGLDIMVALIKEERRSYSRFERAILQDLIIHRFISIKRKGFL